MREPMKHLVNKRIRSRNDKNPDLTGRFRLWKSDFLDQLKGKTCSKGHSAYIGMSITYLTNISSHIDVLDVH